MTVIFSGRVTKAIMILTKIWKKIHILPQLDPWNLFPLSSGIQVFRLANQNPLDHQVAFQGRAAPNMNLIQLKTKELLRCHCGWYGTQVSIAVRYVLDACHPKKA